MSNISDKLLTEELMDYLPLLLRTLFHYNKNGVGMQLPPLQMRVLIVIQRTGILSMSEMAEHLTIQRQQLTKIVDALEEKGLVIRKENEVNRRMLFIEATEKGNQWMKDFIQQKTEMIHQYLEKLDNDERHVVYQAVAILEKHLNDYMHS